jgi:hypothetical protein
MRCTWIALVVSVLLAGHWPTPVRAQKDQEPPDADRPEDFSGLVGFCRVTSSAAPTKVAVEDPLTLTVGVTGDWPRDNALHREKMRRLFSAALARDFFVEAKPERDRFLERQKTCEFFFILRPKRLDVKQIPGLKLAYYLPNRRRFQSTYSPEIPLEVTARAEVKPPPEAIAPLKAPESFFRLITGPEVVRRDRPWRLGFPAWIALVLAPPGLCGLWYWRWRRLHPNGTQRRQQRRSLAAQRALYALKHQPDATVAQTLSLMATYLRDRLDFGAAEPTPAEVASLLWRAGAPRPLCRRFGDFFRSCDAARFGPLSAEPAPMGAEAMQLIRALEMVPSLRPVRMGPSSLWGFSTAVKFGLIVFLATALGSGLLCAEEGNTSSNAEVASQAERDFQEGVSRRAKAAEARPLFASAADSYAELYRRGIRNRALLRNWGNAAFLAGRPARAILAFQHGLLLAPGDHTLRESLEYVRGEVEYPPGTRPDDSSWPPWLPRPSAELILFLALGLYTLGCLGLTRRLVIGRPSWGVAVLFLLAAATGVSGGLLKSQEHRNQEHALVVIAADAIPFQRGNGESYPAHPDVATLREGMEARLLHERGDWLQIQLSGGQIGWVPKRAAVLMTAYP